MNIWCISKYASPPNYSKMPARFFILAKEFMKLGNDVTLITSDSNHLAHFPPTEVTYNKESFEGLPIIWIKTKKYGKTASISRVLSWFDFEKKLFLMDISHHSKPNVVIISSLSIFSILYGYYLKKKFGTFLVFEIRDIWPLTMTEEGGFSKWHPLVILIGMIEKIGYKYSDLIVGTMPKLDEHIKNILGYERPFLCSPLGFVPNTDKNLLQENPFEEVFPKNKIIIGYAGSMGITNALECFIEVIKKLQSQEKIHFMLVGSGDLRETFEKTLEGCLNVTFLPRIEQDKIKYFLQKCDILYLSTKNSKVWEYGQSMNKVVEYMLASKPIIASYAGYPSMINEAHCGRFITTSTVEDLASEILDIASLDEKQRRTLGENGQKWIYENRQYPKLAKEYIYKINTLRSEECLNHYLTKP